VTIYTGGYLDRLIIIAVNDVLRDGLEALGWFDAGRSHLPIQWRSGPTPVDKQIAYNTCVVSFETIEPAEMEVGSDAVEITHTGYVDFYAEPAPDPDDEDNTFNGGEALGKHFIGDVWSVLVGDIPSIGRDRPVIDVLDYGMCVDEETEALTSRGWLKYSELSVDDELFVFDIESGGSRWEHPRAVNVFPRAPRSMVRMRSRLFDALVTTDHKWPIRGWSMENSLDRMMATSEIRGRKRRLIMAGGGKYDAPDVETVCDELVELVGWYLTEGSCYSRGHSISIGQSIAVNEPHVIRIRRLARFFRERGATVTESERVRKSGPFAEFYFGKGVGRLVKDLAPQKQITTDFLRMLTLPQLELLFATLMRGDGSDLQEKPSHRPSQKWRQKDEGRLQGFEILCAMLGRRTHRMSCEDSVNGPEYQAVAAYRSSEVHCDQLTWSDEHYEGVIWCPTTASGTWMARRNGFTFWTGNSTPSYLFSVYVDKERTRTSKVHRFNQPWERDWYTCVFELIEERFGILDGYAGGYSAGGY
jgi:hypothetical protein